MVMTAAMDERIPDHRAMNDRAMNDRAIDGARLSRVNRCQ
jgi:uncharacterized protein (DUF2342 family)